MNPIDTSIFVGKFVEEARDRLKALGAALLRLEQTPGAAGAICRGPARGAQHQGLGADARVHRHRSDLAPARRVVRRGENQTIAARRRRVRRHLRGVDQMTSRVEALARGHMDAVEVGEICNRLRRSAVQKGVGRGFRRRLAKTPPDPLWQTPVQPRVPRCGSRCACRLRSSTGWRTSHQRWWCRASKPSSGTPSCGGSSACSAGCAIACARRASHPTPISIAARSSPITPMRSTR